MGHTKRQNESDNKRYNKTQLDPLKMTIAYSPPPHDNCTCTKLCGVKLTIINLSGPWSSQWKD